MDALYQLSVVWIGVLIAVFLAKRTRLTPVLFYLAVGAVFVNTGVLPEEEHPFIRGFAEVGIVLIMFALGFEEHINNFLQSIKRSWGIAFFGALAPFAAAYLVADYFWDDPRIALLCGLTMTATAVSLTMVTLRSEGLQGSPAATRIMTSAVLDDIASLALVAMLIPIATGEASPSVAGIGFVAGKAVLFFVLVSLLGGLVFPGGGSRFPWLSKLGIRQVLSFDDRKHMVLIVLLLAVIIGLIGHAFGFHPAVGAYMAGLILREEYFADKTGNDGSGGYEKTKDIVDSVAFSWIGPVFFVQLGTEILLDWPILVSVIPHTIALTVSVFVCQILSAALAARYTSGLSMSDSWLVGFGMLGRAELAFVVLNIAYVQHAILTTEAFYMLMITAFWLNVSVPITISLWKHKIGSG